MFRMHQRRKFDFRKGRCLGIEDHVVTWPKPARPDWMDEETYAQIPEELTVRELRLTVDQPGFRVNELVLVTTMLDAVEYTKEEIGRLFLDRWNIELDFRSIKVVLQMDVLRCQTPEMVRKEIWMHLLAYNLIRGVMRDAAEAHEKRPRHLSFKGALQALSTFLPLLGLCMPLASGCSALVSCIATHRVGNRPDRYEPRLVKRRPKTYKHLREPRANYKRLAA